MSLFIKMFAKIFAVVFFRTLLLSFIFIANNTYAQAQNGAENLNRFLQDVQTYSAEFDQVVLDENLQQIDEGSGTLSILRPGRFRWDYFPPDEQQIIGDGKKVWLFDVELKQVIIRDQEKSLGQSPAILLAGEGIDYSQYEFEDRGLQGKIRWVKIIPKNNHSGFDDIQVGFIGTDLSAMVLVDGLGQTTRIQFRAGIENASLPADQFQFIPPDDVDVIDETQ